MPTDSGVLEGCWVPEPSATHEALIVLANLGRNAGRLGQPPPCRARYAQPPAASGQLARLVDQSVDPVDLTGLRRLRRWAVG